ncbi:MAG: cytochrome P450 [Gammaproteobacteria bacterium]|nr:cytochrome P450 [Gammaproteobacteria bacterium]
MNRTSDPQNRLREAPGPKGCPLTGSLPMLASNILRFFERVTANHGDIALFTLGRKKVYLISHPKDLATLFADERKGGYSRQFFHEAYKPSFGNGIFNSYGETWQKQRQILQPYFQKRAIEAWFPILREETELTIQRLTTRQQPHIDVEREILPLVQSIMCRILFGRPLDDDDSRRAVEAINTVSRYNVTRSISAFILNGVFNRLPTPGNRKFHQALDDIDRTLTNLRVKAEQAGDDSSLIAQLAPHFAAQELRDHLFTLFFGGQDTTVNAIAFTLYYLGKHPMIQQRAAAEIESVVGATGPLAYQDLKRLSYTDSVINESMRLAPPAYAAYRDVIGDRQLRDARIRDRSLVVFSPYLTHRHPDFWQDPERFDPERFMSGSAQERFAFMPYGGGMRTCLGMNLARVEILTVVALLLHHFQWTLPENYPVKFVPHMTLKARKGITIQCSKRT